MSEIIVYSGSANQPLAQNIAKGTGGRSGKVEISRFVNGEARVRVVDDPNSSSVVVVQSLSKPVDRHIVEFGLICDALYRAGAHEINAVIPWLAYSKQDKVFRPGEPLSVKVIAKMLQVIPIKRIYTFDLHNLAILGFFEVPVTNLTARSLFVEHFRKKVTDKTIIIAPDAGAIKASTSFAGELEVPVAYMDKKRDLKTGKVTVVGISRDVHDADVIIVDDMIVTGDTLIETAKYLKEKGVRSIAVGATHHLYVDGAQERLDASMIDEIVVTDTIVSPVTSPKLTVLSVAGVVAEELKRRVSV